MDEEVLCREESVGVHQIEHFLDESKCEPGFRVQQQSDLRNDLLEEGSSSNYLCPKPCDRRRQRRGSNCASIALNQMNY